MFVAFMVGPCACDCLLFSSQARLCVCLLVCLCVCDSSPPPTCCYVCRTKTFPSERAMLSFFLTRLFQADPDVIVGHNLFGLDLDVLMHRMKQHNIPQWSRIGRLKRKKMPNLQVCTRYCYLSACLPVCLPADLSVCLLVVEIVFCVCTHQRGFVCILAGGHPRTPPRRASATARTWLQTAMQRVGVCCWMCSTAHASSSAKSATASQTSSKTRCSTERECVCLCKGERVLCVCLCESV